MFYFVLKDWTAERTILTLSCGKYHSEQKRPNASRASLVPDTLLQCSFSFFSVFLKSIQKYILRSTSGWSPLACLNVPFPARGCFWVVGRSQTYKSLSLAPLQIQKLQIFSNFSLRNSEFSRFLQIFGEICSNLRFFAQIFTEFCRNCGNVK